MSAVALVNSDAACGFSSLKCLEVSTCMSWRQTVLDLLYHCYRLISSEEKSRQEELIHKLRTHIARGESSREVAVSSLADEEKRVYYQIVSSDGFEDSVASYPTSSFIPECLVYKKASTYSSHSQILQTALKTHFTVLGLKSQLIVEQVKREKAEEEVIVYEKEVLNKALLSTELHQHSLDVVREYISRTQMVIPSDFEVHASPIANQSELTSVIFERFHVPKSEHLIVEGTKKDGTSWFIIHTAVDSVSQVECWVERSGSYSCWDYAKFKLSELSSIDFNATLKKSQFEGYRICYPLLPSFMIPPSLLPASPK